MATRDAREAPLNEPLWWRALTDYVSQMQAAWLTFAAHGRRELPRLRVVFAMLAGGAPLLSERLATRGGPELDLADPLVFYDTSSYGPQMVDDDGAVGGTRASSSTARTDRWSSRCPADWRRS